MRIKEINYFLTLFLYVFICFSHYENRGIVFYISLLMAIWSITGKTIVYKITLVYLWLFSFLLCMIIFFYNIPDITGNDMDIKNINTLILCTILSITYSSLYTCLYLKYIVRK